MRRHAARCTTRRLAAVALLAGALLVLRGAWRRAALDDGVRQLARCWDAAGAGAGATGAEAVPAWDDGALRRFALGAAGNATEANAAGPLLYTTLTRGFVDMAAHWACRARDAAQRPHAVALDGAATCAALNALVAWLPCHALGAETGVETGARAFEAFGTRAYHELMALRSALAWRLLARGRDILQCDSDAVFAQNATLRLQDFIDARADVQTLERAMLDTTGVVVRALVDARVLTWPNFGLVYARASARTVALFRFLWSDQIAPRPGKAHDDQIVYTYCANVLFARGVAGALVHTHFDRRRFVDGLYWHGGRATLEHAAGRAVETGRPMRFYGDGDGGGAAPPVLVHLTWAPSEPKLRLLGYWGLWRAACGDTAALATRVDAPRPGGPRLFGGTGENEH